MVHLFFYIIVMTVFVESKAGMGYNKMIKSANEVKLSGRTENKCNAPA